MKLTGVSYRIQGLALLVVAGLLSWMSALAQADACQPHLATDGLKTLLGIYRDACSMVEVQSTAPDEFALTLQLNNFGQHAPDYALEKAPAERRLLILGDSYAQGLQVNQSETFPNQLNDLLDQAATEVINLSMDGYSTDRQLLLYSYLGWRFQPDVVLLALYVGNDVQENQVDLQTRRYGYALPYPIFSLRTDQLRLHNSPLFDRALYPDSAPYQWLVEQHANQTAAPPANPPMHPIVLGTAPYRLEYPVELGLYLPEDNHWAEAWEVTEALIRQLRDLVKEQGIAFGVVVIPDRRAVHIEDWWRTQAEFESLTPAIMQADPLQPVTRLLTFLQEDSIPTLDLTSILRANAETGRLYFLIDGHFNPRGHTVAARTISEWLVAQNWLTP